jgi:hypothetical protein
LILHSLPQFNNFAGSNFGSKWVQVSRDVGDHSQRSGVVSGCEMQVPRSTSSLMLSRGSNRTSRATRSHS